MLWPWLTHVMLVPLLTMLYHVFLQLLPACLSALHCVFFLLLMLLRNARHVCCYPLEQPLQPMAAVRGQKEAVGAWPRA